MTLYEHYQIERSEGRSEGREEGREEGRTEGRIEGRAESVDALIANTDWSLEQACKALNFSVDEYKAAKELV